MAEVSVRLDPVLGRLVESELVVDIGALLCWVDGGDLLAAKLFGCVMIVIGPINCPFCSIWPPVRASRARVNTIKQF